MPEETGTEATPAQASNSQPGPPRLSFVEAFMKAAAEHKISKFCAECRRAREWSDWNLTPMPVGMVALVLGPVLHAHLTCLKCGHVRLFNLSVLGINVNVEQSRIVTPDGQPATPGGGIITP